MNKKTKFLYFWCIDFWCLLLLILIPKDADSYAVLSLMTMFMIFVIPLVLLFSQDYIMFVKREKRDEWDGVPNIGIILIILSTFVNFVGSIEKIAVPQMITILILFVSVELLLGYIKVTYKEISLKKYIWIDIATYFSLLMFFACAMIISVDYGLI